MTQNKKLSFFFLPTLTDLINDPLCKELLNVDLVISTFDKGENTKEQSDVNEAARTWQACSQIGLSFELHKDEAIKQLAEIGKGNKMTNHVMG